MKKRTRCAALAAGLCFLAASACVVWGQAGGLGKGRSVDVEAAQVEAAGLTGDDYEGWNALLAENEISEDFREGLAGFAFQSGSAVLSEAEDNAFFSPLSLYYALAVLGTGAEGETEAELLAALGAEGKEDLARQCAALFQRYVYQEERAAAEAEAYGESVPDGSLRLANSLWVSEKIKLDSDYRKTCAEDFFASSHAVDFADADTGKRMGEWISEQTNGALAPTVELSPETLLSILNTLYFYGGWQDKFDEKQTAEDVFHLENGGEVSVPFMNRTDPMGSFVRGDGYTVSGLFTNNNCEVLFVLPDEGTDVEVLLENPEILRDIFVPEEGKWSTGEVTWKVPKFSFGSHFDLKETLASMGLERMFDSEAADFSAMSSSPLFVNQVLQETHVGVDEEGVEGAAYTMIALAGAGMPDDTQKAQMILDRPFLFGIRDYRNDVWLFLGVCGNPAGEEESETASVTDPGGSISLRVPDGWVCEACPEGEDGFDYSLRLYPEGEEKGYVEVAYAPNYGICGTGMEYKEIELAGKKANAVKDIDAGRWEYIFFEDSDVLVTSWDAGSWFSKNAGQLMEILDTLRF